MQRYPVALITGGARRIGAVISRTLHAAGFNVIIHCHQSVQHGQALAEEFNQQRPHSAAILVANLNHMTQLNTLIHQAHQEWGQLNVLVNNASSFFPTEIGKTSETEWDELMNSNLKAPYFLAQAAAPFIASQQGCIINIADIHGQRPLKGYPVYSVAKAGLIMLTQALARELAPDIRVNAIAPGISLLPDHTVMEEAKIKFLIEKNLLKRFANPQDIANAVLFLIHQASITGQTLNIDCGRSVRQ